MLKGSIRKKQDITFVNIHKPNTEAPKYTNHMVTNIKREIYNKTIIVGGFCTSLTSVDISSRQKIGKTTEVLNDILEQMDLTDIKSRHSIHKKNNTHSSQVHM